MNDRSSENWSQSQYRTIRIPRPVFGPVTFQIWKPPTEEESEFPRGTLRPKVKCIIKHFKHFWTKSPRRHWYPVTWSYIMVPHGDEVFWGHIINKVLIEVHLTVNSKYPWTHPVPMSQLPKASSNRHIWYLTNSLHCRTFFGMYKNIYYYEGGQVGSLAEIVIPKQFCISGRKMKEISITLKDLKSSKKIKC